LKKQVAELAVALLVGATLALAGPKKHPDFSGTWVLDKAATSDVPSSLDNYTLTAEQSATQITLATKIKGEFRSRRSSQNGQAPDDDGSNQGGNSGGGYPSGGNYPGGGGNYPGGGGNYPGGGYPGGGYPGGGYPGGIGYPGGRIGGIGGIGVGRRGGRYPGGGGRRRTERPSEARVLAMTAPNGSFALNGQECSVDLQGRMQGRATVKAKWVKGGKDLELDVVRHLGTQGDTMDLKSKERWNLSDDGQTLVVERSMKGPRGSQSAKLTFRRASEEKKAQ
jgi:hypothetical protein